MALVSRTAAGGGDGGVNGWYKKKGDAWKLDKGMPLSEVDGKLDECGGVMARCSDTERSKLCWHQGTRMRV